MKLAIMAQRGGATTTTFNASSNLSTTFSEAELMMFPEHTAFTIIWHFCPPLLLLLGVPGNVVTIMVLRRLWSNGSSQLPFLLSLAIADLCLLVSGLLFDMCFYVFDWDLREFHVVPCKVLTFTMNCSSTVAAWLLVAVTAQRAVSVMHPYRVAACCSASSCYCVLAAIVVASCVLQCHVLIGEHVPGVHPEGYCTSSTFTDVSIISVSTWSMVDLVASCLLPSLVLPVCNVFLIRGLRASHQTLRHLSSCNLPAGDSRRRLASSMTTVVPLLSLAFVCLTLPIYGYIIWSDLRRDAINSNPRLFARAELAWAVTNMLWYANSTINFLLYCVSGSKFRKEFLQLFKRGQRRRCCSGRVRSGGKYDTRCSRRQRSTGRDTAF